MARAIHSQENIADPDTSNTMVILIQCEKGKSILGLYKKILQLQILNRLEYNWFSAAL